MGNGTMMGLSVGSIVGILPLLLLGGCSSEGSSEKTPEAIVKVRQAAPPPEPGYAIPIRWCAVRGTPIQADPMAAVGEATLNDALWRRHERPSDNFYIPGANVTMRSAVIFETASARGFPVIEDPNPIGSPGDVLDPREDTGAEMLALLNSCATAWEALLASEATSDIGVLALSVRRIVDSTGTAVPVYGISLGADGVDGSGMRRLVAIDPAFLLTRGSMRIFDDFFRGDDIGAVEGHEIGHTWPIPPFNDLTLPGLRHTNGGRCVAPPGNLMGGNPGVIDANGDLVFDVLDGIAFHSASADLQVEQETVFPIELACTNIDQRDAIRRYAPDIPGCKIIGTNDDCSTLSDLEVDPLSDVPLPEVDLSTVAYTEPEATPVTLIRHDLAGRIAFTNANELAYYTALDLDGNPATGGAPAAVGMPTVFQGAELVARVLVEFGEGTFVTPTVWTFSGGAFAVSTDPGIDARISPMSFEIDSFSGTADPIAPGPDNVVLTVPNAVRGPRSESVRMQAVTQATFSESSVIDRLDDRPGEPGVSTETTPPSFPTCSGSPNPADAEGTVSVSIQGLVPNQPIHLLLGPDAVATGVAGPTGNATVAFELPSGIRGGNHLITVGTDGTSLTADCFVEVVLPPECEQGDDLEPPSFSFVPGDVTTSQCLRPNLGEARATDRCGARVSNDAPGVFPLGTTIVTWRAVDPAGNLATATQRVVVTLGNDAGCCPAGTNVILGTSGNDVINGTNGPDCIFGLGAQDTINGLGGGDFISGGDGNDVINAGDGNDMAFGGTGQDRLNGGSGNDTLDGSEGDDICRGGNGDDTLRGGQGQDDLFGEIGNDTLFGDAGDDDLFGDAGNDHLVGGGIHDRCSGGTGTNTFVTCEGSINSCASNTRNGLETGVDCGGACPGCSAGGACVVTSDCRSGLFCSNGSCHAGADAPSVVTATRTISDDWGGGYCATLSVTNGGTTPVTWTVNLNVGASTIFTSWNGTFSGSSGALSVSPAFSWNHTLAPGATDSSVGFCANRNVPGSGVLPVVLGATGSPP